MDKNINILNSKDNILELDIEIEGIKPNNTQCFFVIKTKDVNFSFECKHSEKNIWLVTIPRMPQIENTMYDFFIYMTIDGYYFEPYTGTLNVMKSNDVYVKDISNKTFEPNEKKDIPNKDINETQNIEKKELLTDKLIKKESSITKKIMNDTTADQIIKNIIKDTKKKISPSIKLKKGEITEL